MEFNPQFFESIMLICFGVSWPFAIVKTYRTKRVEGKSLFFLCCVLLGYLSGISFKLTGTYDQVIWLYVSNSAMVSTEIFLFLRYSGNQGMKFC
jgi:hypothetical protein